MNLLAPEAASIDVDRALASFAKDGYAALGRVASDAMLQTMRDRADDVMLGRVTYEGLFFQLDTTTGNYDDLEYGLGWQGPSLEYRKIEKLERDPIFQSWIDLPLFERIVRARVPPGDIAIYRAIFMGKSARGGTHLPWHQDGGKFWGLDRDPDIQIWTALDDAPEDGGCIEVFPGSHAAGLVTPTGGVVPKNHVDARGAEANVVKLPVRAGEVILLHNHLWHRSGLNTTGKPRRAFSVCYMSAATKCLRTKRAPRTFHRVFVRDS